jgi:hypothetical protein
MELWKLFAFVSLALLILSVSLKLNLIADDIARIADFLDPPAQVDPQCVIDASNRFATAGDLVRNK